MRSQHPLFPPRTTLNGPLHISRRLVARGNVNERGVLEHQTVSTWLGMRWVAGTLRIRFRASVTVLRGGR